MIVNNQLDRYYTKLNVKYQVNTKNFFVTSIGLLCRACLVFNEGIQPRDVSFLFVFEAVECYHIFHSKSRSGLRISRQGLFSAKESISHSVKFKVRQRRLK